MLTRGTENEFKNSRPSPPWGRGWLASGAVISRGETGEGVKNVTTQKAMNSTAPPHPRRKHRSIARGVKLMGRARDLRQTATETEQEAWRLLRTLRLRAFKF